jgi:O-antigen ligase
MRSIVQAINKYCHQLSQITLVGTGFAIPLSISLMNALLGFTVLFSLLAGQWQQKWAKAKANPMVWLLLGLVGLSLISCLYTVANTHEAITDLRKYGKLGYIFFLLPLFTERLRRQATNAFLLAVIVTLLLSYAKFFGIIHIGELDHDYTEIFHNRIMTSLFFALATFIFIQRILYTAQYRAFYTLLVTLLVVNILFIGLSRTGYLALAVGMLVVFWQRWHWRGMLLAAIAFLLLASAAWLVSDSFQQRVHELAQSMLTQQTSKDSIGLRKSFIHNTLQLIEEHPWIGTGVGSFRVLYNQRFEPVDLFPEGALPAPHNQYLLTATHFGLLGLAWLGFIFFMQWRYSRLLSAPERWLAPGVIAIFAVTCLVDDFINLPPTGNFYVYFSALLYSALPTSARIARRKPSRVPLSNVQEKMISS